MHIADKDPEGSGRKNIPRCSKLLGITHEFIFFATGKNKSEPSVNRTEFFILGDRGLQVSAAVCLVFLQTAAEEALQA